MNLEAYLPTPVVLCIAGKEIPVAPIKVRNIPAFARAAAPVMAAMASGDLLAAVAEAGDELIAAVAIATGEPADWLGDLDADDFVRLAGAVIEVNADFFARKLAPAIAAASEKVANATAGASFSPSSSPVASAGTNA